MMQIGDKIILWQIMKIYSQIEFNGFVIIKNKLKMKVNVK